MDAQRSMPSSARERYYKRRLKRTGVLFTAALVLAVFVCGSFVSPVLAPVSSLGVSSSITNTPKIEPTEQIKEVTVPTTIPTKYIESEPAIALPTLGQIVPPSEDTHVLYYALAGDSLPVVSLRFGVEMAVITSDKPIENSGLIDPGQLLIIPNNLEEISTSSTSKLLPDSEVTFSPSTVEFDTQEFLDNAGGYLATYEEWVETRGRISGAEVIDKIALEYSVNPRLLLAFVEFRSGWVYGFPESTELDLYPLQNGDLLRKNLYYQLAWFSNRVMDGYYGWREGRRLVVNFDEGQVLRLAPKLNAGSVGLMNAFTYIYDFEEWSYQLYGDDSFFVLHENMFDNPWIRAQTVEPLIPPDTVQPEMILPFEAGRKWAFTGGPHPAWNEADVWAALDFAPPSSGRGCLPSFEWVVASMPGLVVRSGNGLVVVDLDGDGYEQTGWTILYLHIATNSNLVKEGEWLEAGDRIGNPSCEGGRSTGTHLHMARRYNGEWVPADGPLPFVLSGWKARAGTRAYQGWLTRGSDIIYANSGSPSTSHIFREE